MERKTKLGSVPFARLAGLAAIGFGAIIFLANATILVPAGMPSPGSPVDEVVEFFAAEGGAVEFGSVFTPAAWVLATVFGAGAGAVLWRGERSRSEAWSLVGFAGVILQNCTMVGVIALRLTLAEVAGDDPDAVPLLWAFHDGVFTLNSTFLAVALAGLSIGGLRGGLIRPWQTALGLVAAALLFASASLTPLVMEHGGGFGLLGLAGWLLWVVWLVAYGVSLIRLPARGLAPRRSPAGAERPSPPATAASGGSARAE